MNTHTPIDVRRFTGKDVLPFLDDVARLRMTVFRDWPYLYDGDAAYERDYLSAYARSPRSVFVLAFDQGQVIGASTGIPLAEDAPAFRQPFIARGLAVDPVFYFGESVLLADYRGQGIGHAFFDHRESHARALGAFTMTAFAAVDRRDDDTRKPTGFRGNDAFWQKRGYARQDGMTLQLEWNELQRGEILHDLTFWLRPLEAIA